MIQALGVPWPISVTSTFKVYRWLRSLKKKVLPCNKPPLPAFLAKNLGNPENGATCLTMFQTFLESIPIIVPIFSPRPSALSPIVLFIQFPALRQDPWAKLSPSACFSTFVTSRVIQHDTRLRFWLLARWETPFFDRKPSPKMVRFHHFNNSRLASPNGNCT